MAKPSLSWSSEADQPPSLNGQQPTQRQRLSDFSLDGDSAGPPTMPIRVTDVFTGQNAQRHVSVCGVDALWGR